MLQVLADFLDLLARQPETVVASRELDGVVWSEVTRSGVRALIVANAALPPVSHSRKGQKGYGAYSIVQDDYPDWIKGDDPFECVAHVLGWFDGLAARALGRAIAMTDLTRLSHGEVERPGVDAVIAEMERRSALRVTGFGRMTSLDGRHTIGIDATGSVIRVLDGAGSYSVTAGTVGICAAAILGFTDGLSLDSDD